MIDRDRVFAKDYFGDIKFFPCGSDMERYDFTSKTKCQCFKQIFTNDIQKNHKICVGCPHNILEKPKPLTPKPIEIHIHDDETCHRTECGSKGRFATYRMEEYEFEYKHQTYAVLIHPCFFYYRFDNRFPHTDVLNAALKILMYNPPEGKMYGLISNTTNNNHPYNQSEYWDPPQFKDTVVEVCSKSKFHHYFYVRHNVNDLNVDEILKMEPEPYSNKWNNMIALLNKLNKPAPKMWH